MPDKTVSCLELEQKLRPLGEPLPHPRPGDWLAEHVEPGQTFAEYLHAQPVRKSDQLKTIYLCLVGDFSEAQSRIVDLTKDYLALFFDCPVKVNRQVPSDFIPARARRASPAARVEPSGRLTGRTEKTDSESRARPRPVDQAILWYLRNTTWMEHCILIQSRCGFAQPRKSPSGRRLPPMPL